MLTGFPAIASVSDCSPGLLSALLKVDYESEKLTWELIVGGGLVIAANVLGFWPPSPRTETGVAV